MVHGTRTRGGRFNDVSYGALPFLAALLALIGCLLAFPDIATWLPSQVY
ncbi:MAG: hypothetical protein AAGG09_01555 [Pseudomonadota bacterium]